MELLYGISFALGAVGLALLLRSGVFWGASVLLFQQTSVLFGWQEAGDSCLIQLNEKERNQQCTAASTWYERWVVEEREMKTSRGEILCMYKREEALCGECRNPQRAAELQSFGTWVGMWVSLICEGSSLELSAPLSKLWQECKQRGRFCAQRWADGCWSVEEILLAF